MFKVFTQGVARDLLDGVDTKARRTAASRAINRVARDGRAELAKRVIRDINLPASYVSPSQNRLRVEGFARPDSLEAVIAAQRRRTSLARFATSPPTIGRAGVSVSVKRGSVIDLKRAFFLKLPAGRETDSRFNMGLAIRLPLGQRPRESFGAVEIAPGLWGLYGPSVAQILENREGSGEKLDILPQLGDELVREFLRQLRL